MTFAVLKNQARARPIATTVSYELRERTPDYLREEFGKWLRASPTSYYTSRGQVGKGNNKALTE